MPRRKIKLEVKVEAMREGLRLMNVDDLQRKYGVSKQSMYNWYNRILESLPEVLADEKPGRKAPREPEQTPPF
jgi:transposase